MYLLRHHRHSSATISKDLRQDMTESCPDLLFLLFLNISIIIIGMRSSLGSIELCPFALALAYL